MLEFEYFEKLESSWERLKNTKLPVFIYGMGDGCNKILAKLKEYKIQCSGIFASDEFVRGHEFAGFKVQRYSEIEQNHNDFIVVPAFGTSLDNVMSRLETIAQNHILIMPDTPVIGKEYFDKTEFLSRFAQVQKVYDVLADEQSKNTYVNVLSYKITGDISYLSRHSQSPDETYRSILKLDKDEIYVDLGAFNGDTVEEFLYYTNSSYKKVYALEPDRKNFRKCIKNLIKHDNIELYNAAAWSRDEIKSFDGNSGRQGKLSEKGKLTQCLSVDSVLAGKPCTYIKYDVEGAEYQAVIGSKHTISKFSPKICTALYHRAYDMIDLPLLINEINPNYKMFMRQYPYYPAWETNLFCIK